jgi:Spy/CpxP family protein refolding chaperone
MFKKSTASYLFAALTTLGAASVASQAHAQTAASPQTDAVVVKAGQKMHKQDHGRKYGGQARHHRQQHGKFWQGLDLTEAQRDEIFRIRHEQAPALRQQYKEVRHARIQLAELSRAEKFDDTAAVTLTNELGKAQAQIALSQARAQAKMAAVLTPEQREKLSKKKADRRANGSMRDTSNKASTASL